MGIFPTTWILEGGFFFDDETDLAGFKRDLELLFEGYCSDNITIETEEELDEREKLIGE